MRVFLTLLLFALVQKTVAQVPDVKPSVQNAMQEVSEMVGVWEGRSWHSNKKGQKEYSNVRENIQWRLDQTLLVMEGQGKDDNDRVVHHAFGVLSYDPFRQTYQMNTYLAKGLSRSATFEVLKPNERFRWQFESNRGTIRYTIAIASTGTWEEVGEFSSDGESWRQFFEMELHRVEQE